MQTVNACYRSLGISIAPDGRKSLLRRDKRPAPLTYGATALTLRARGVDAHVPRRCHRRTTAALGRELTVKFHLTAFAVRVMVTVPSLGQAWTGSAQEAHRAG